MGVRSGIGLSRAIARLIGNALFLALFAAFSSFVAPSLASDTLFKGQSIGTNGSLLSQGSIFRLGFFTRGSPGRYFLGIWYSNISTQTPVWIANRESPADEKGQLRLSNSGVLELVGGGGNVLWSSNSTPDYTNCSSRMCDDGNLIIQSGNDQKSTIWESFDHPTDTLLPGMKMTMDRATGEITRFVSWKSSDDPAPGNFTLGLDPRGSAQIYIWNGSAIHWRSGEWNKISFVGITRMKALSVYGFSLNPNDNGKMVLSFTYTTPFLRFVMMSNGIETTFLWTPENQSWTTVWQQPLTTCEKYNFCGNDSRCDDEAPTRCVCLQGFEEKPQGALGSRCARRTPLRCAGNDTDGGFGFKRLEDTKLPDFSQWVSAASDETTCGAFCTANCSCNAYSFVADVGCLVWSVDLVDIARLPAIGTTLFLKLDNSDLDYENEESKRILWIVLPIVLGTVILACLICGWRYRAKIQEWKVKRQKGRGSSVVQSTFSGDGQTQSSDPKESEDQDEDATDLPVFGFDVIAAATDSFSIVNKLGEGGFGVVYKGVLPGGEEIAVKRLSTTSGQGIDEFKNEAKLIAKLQHRNLVRLLGCCFQGEEKLLIYEYMPNKSLDFFLFDRERQYLLSWSKRFDIIEGIARGILYLHRDSRLRVVHRDLKASNILLDEEMNPKISDFGMARIFGGNQNHDNTNRVVGTFGYMSPEYAMEGLFSVKSDVYSFGVLLLEIVSGKKNTRTQSESYTNLLGFAWQRWTEGRPEDLVDPSIRKATDMAQAVRCIHVALLCVQDRANDRPTISSVVILLSSQTSIPQAPRQPTFLADSNAEEIDLHKLNAYGTSVNDLTITALTGR